MSEKINVSTLVRYLKNKLDSDIKLQGVLVSGEISNFHRHNSGHLYFTLKDEKSSISCVMFSSKASYLKFEPKNGDKVIVNANTSIFETSGQLQLYVNSLKLDGVGDLYQQYEELKNKLFDEGYFNEENKKEIETLYPEKIAVLVGDKSAAMSDIKTQFLRRWPLCNVDYYPVLVQGNDAAADIIEKLLKVDSLDYDAIILARGGGSFEDLFCFNDEKLVKTIFSLNTFIITGVGHEKDFTLVDFVSDERAPTPTAAVELITPNIVDVMDNIKIYYKDLNYTMNSKISNIKKELDSLIKNKYLINPLLLVDKKKLKLDYFNQYLNNYSNRIVNTKLVINNNIRLIKNSLNNKFNRVKTSVNSYNELLNAYSLDKTLKRGYSIVYQDEKIINSKNKLNKKDLRIRLYDGEINALIKE